MNGQEQRAVGDMGDEHVATAPDTPLREDAFVLRDEEKIDRIAGHFAEIMQLLGLDLTDDSLQGTPYRVAKMYVTETLSGLNPDNKPNISLFENPYQYHQMLVEKDITFYSTCEHHFVPIYGKAHVAYITQGKVIGLSKLNRLVQYCARRPQVQERMTIQIARELQQALATEHVAVIIDAYHLCVASRGIQDTTSKTVTTAYFGKFEDAETKRELLSYLKL